MDSQSLERDFKSKYNPETDICANHYGDVVMVTWAEYQLVSALAALEKRIMQLENEVAALAVTRGSHENKT